MLEKLILAGVSVFRLNLSHGAYEDHIQVIKNIRSLSIGLHRYTGILADLQGPKIRTTETLNNAPVFISAGQMVNISSAKGVSNDKTIYVTYPNLMKEIEIGHRIAINDGTISLKAVSRDDSAGFIQCKAINSGSYSSRKGVNFPDSNMMVASLTPKDKRDLDFILNQELDYVALSFVREGKDMRKLKKIINETGSSIKCIAKIEKPQAIENFEEILDESDGIMVARGDLGVEIGAENTPIAQKKCIAEANARGKTVIVATQMLESMINSPMPTRAESTDVANAILDGADAVMLSGETAMGQFPVETVKMMRSIIETTESSSIYVQNFRGVPIRQPYPTYSLCEAAAYISKDMGNIPVLVLSITGGTAHYISKIRFQEKIFAFTPYVKVARQLSLSWNIHPFVIPFGGNLMALEHLCVELLLEEQLVKEGGHGIFICGTSSEQGASKLLKMIKFE